MTITKPKAKPSLSTNADAFISGAPDAVSQSKGVVKGNKVQISLTIAPELLDKVDQLAMETGQSRAAVINLAIYKLIQTGM